MTSNSPLGRERSRDAVFEPDEPGLPAGLAQRFRKLGGEPRLARTTRTGQQSNAQIPTAAGPIEQILLFPVASDQLLAQAR